MIGRFSSPTSSAVKTDFIGLKASSNGRFRFNCGNRMHILIGRTIGRVGVSGFAAEPLPFEPLAPPFFGCYGGVIECTLRARSDVIAALRSYKSCFRFGLIVGRSARIRFFNGTCRVPPPPFCMRPASVCRL